MRPKAVELHLLNPPRRRRRHRRNAITINARGRHRRRVRRNYPALVTHAASRPRGRRGRRRGHVYVGSVRKVANPIAHATGTIMEVLKDAGIGTVGIQANNIVGNLVASSLLGVTGTSRQAVKVGTAVTLATLIGMFMPRYRRLACTAGSAAIALEATKFINQSILPTLPASMQDTLGMGDGVPVSTPAVVKGLSYMSRVRYLPGGSYAEMNTGPLSARINRAGRPNVIGSYGTNAGDTMYDAGGALY